MEQKLKQMNRLKIIKDSNILKKSAHIDDNFSAISMQLINIVDYLNFTYTDKEKVANDLEHILLTSRVVPTKSNRDLYNMLNEYIKKLS